MSEEKKRSRLYIYGERTTGVSILVPESKKAEITEKFYEVLKEYENPKMLDLESKPKKENFIDGRFSPKLPNEAFYDGEKVTPVLDEAGVYEGFPHKYHIDDEVPNISPESKRKLWDDVKPKLIEGIAVSSLPKDKKKIDVGLYSGSGKFYTNKIVSNELKILEWTNIESAKSYLENLK